MKTPVIVGDGLVKAVRSRVYNLPDLWFQPRRFESDRLYRLLGARYVKRYVPTGGDAVMRWLRRRSPALRLVGPSLASLRRYERWTRVAETSHLIGFIGFAALTLRRHATGRLSTLGLSVAFILNLTLGLWPVALQRYNRLRVRRAISAVSRTAPTRHGRS